MNRLLVLTLLMSFLALNTFVIADNNVLIYRAPESSRDFRHAYFVSLLELALNTTSEEYGELPAVPSEMFISQERAVDLVARGVYLDIVWSMTSTAREKLLEPVRVPLLKGLLGCRVAIIRKHDEEKFSSLRSVSDLHEFTIVQGDGWPDVNILRHNGLRVVTSPDYPGMFAMVANGRVDLFFRGITEAWTELETINQPGLAVDRSILLTYPGPIYFFVNRERHALADRIREGLDKAISNGEFDALIKQHPYVIQARQELKKNDRVILTLANPELPVATPLAEPQYWMELDVGTRQLSCID